MSLKAVKEWLTVTVLIGGMLLLALAIVYDYAVNQRWIGSQQEFERRQALDQAREEERRIQRERDWVLREHRRIRQRCTDLRNTPLGSLTTNTQEELRACPSSEELAAIQAADEAARHRP